MRYSSLKPQILSTLSGHTTSQALQPTVSYAGVEGRREKAFVDVNGGTSMLSARSRRRVLNRFMALLSGRFVVTTERRPSGQPILVVQ